MLPSSRVVARVPVVGGRVTALERYVGRDTIGQGGVQIRGPVMHGQVGQGSCGRVVVGVTLAVAATVRQVEGGGIVTEIAGIAGVGVPHTIGHQNVVTGTAGVSILRGIAAAVGVLLPGCGGGEELAGAFQRCWQRSALVEVDILQPGIELASVSGRVFFKGIVVAVAGIATIE